MRINPIHAQRDLDKVKTQWCRTCKVDKPTHAFYKCHRTKCMECKREEKRLKFRNTIKDLCHSCNTWKPETLFGVNSRGDERLKTCNSCSAEKKSKALDVHRVEIKSEPIVTKKDLWYLHKGTVMLFIVGPGEFAMQKCSEAVYSGEIGTKKEREIAKIAIGMLNTDAHNDLDAGPDVIREALNKAQAQYQTQ